MRHQDPPMSKERYCVVQLFELAYRLGVPLDRQTCARAVWGDAEEWRLTVLRICEVPGLRPEHSVLAWHLEMLAYGCSNLPYTDYNWDAVHDYAQQAAVDEDDHVESEERRSKEQACATGT